MKNSPIYILAILILTLTACGGNSESYWETYAEWREANTEWILEQQHLKDSVTGTTEYYSYIAPKWNTTVGYYVLMHWYNDTTLTSGNLTPYETSTVSVKYTGYLYNGTQFDASGDTPVDFSLQNVIEGWQVALQNMHVGDSCRVVIPYQLGYGASMSGDVILPYSTLVFGIKLVDILGYEKRDL